MPWRDLMVQFSYKGARGNLIKKVTFQWQLKPIFTLVFVYFSFYFLNISGFFWGGCQGAPFPRSLWDLRSLTREWTHAPCSGTAGPKPLHRQEIPWDAHLSNTAVSSFQKSFKDFLLQVPKIFFSTSPITCKEKHLTLFCFVKGKLQTCAKAERKV